MHGIFEGPVRTARQRFSRQEKQFVQKQRWVMKDLQFLIQNESISYLSTLSVLLLACILCVFFIDLRVHLPQIIYTYTNLSRLISLYFSFCLSLTTCLRRFDGINGWITVRLFKKHLWNTYFTKIAPKPLINKRSPLVFANVAPFPGTGKGKLS